MKTRHAGLLAVIGLAVLGQAACATPEQWRVWRSHSSHFASGDHLFFSVRNPGERAERVKGTDPTKSQEQTWWGRQLPMAADLAGGS